MKKGTPLAHILVVDDDEIVRRSICKMLEAEGHDVQEAKTGSEGIALFQQNTFDLLITDIFMPEKDGLEVIQELRKQTSHIKILAMTGGGTIGKLNLLPQAKAFGATATIYKPFTRDELVLTINNILNP
jgi:CheY-like chemotaxis protein